MRRVVSGGVNPRLRPRAEDPDLDEVAASVHHSSPLLVSVENIECLPRSRQLDEPAILSPVVLFKNNKSKHYEWREPDYGYAFVRASAGKDLSDDVERWFERYVELFGGGPGEWRRLEVVSLLILINAAHYLRMLLSVINVSSTRRMIARLLRIFISTVIS